MITIYSIKPQFQKALQPFVRILARAKVTPNQVTIFTLLLSAAFGLYLCSGAASIRDFWMLPVVLLVRMGLNAIDGMLARSYRMQTALGSYLNELGDIVSDFFLYLPFAVKIPGAQPLVGAILFLSVLTEAAGILAVSVGAERRYDGPMGKSDRAFCFGILGLLLAFGWIEIILFFAAAGCVALLLLATVFLRIRNGLREAKKP